MRLVACLALLALCACDKQEVANGEYDPINEIEGPPGKLAQLEERLARVENVQNSLIQAAEASAEIHLKQEAGERKGDQGETPLQRLIRESDQRELEGRVERLEADRAGR